MIYIYIYVHIHDTKKKELIILQPSFSCHVAKSSSSIQGPTLPRAAIRSFTEACPSQWGRSGHPGNILRKMGKKPREILQNPQKSGENPGNSSRIPSKNGETNHPKSSKFRMVDMN